MRVLAVGSSSGWTGNGRVLRDVLRALTSAGSDVVQLAIGPEDRRGEHAWEVLSSSSSGDYLGVRTLSRAISALRPDVLLLSYDYWLLSAYTSVLQGLPASERPRVLVHAPIDGPPSDNRHYRDLLNADAIVVPTRYAESVVRSALSALVDASSGHAQLPSIRVIPHGVDPMTFFPLRGTATSELALARREARHRLDPDLRLKDDQTVVVLNANRNRVHKRLDASVDIIRHVKAGLLASGTRADVRLLFHVARDEAGLDLEKSIADSGLADCITVAWVPSRRHIDDAYLNLVYNACEIGINTSTAEGWGLIATEHAATCAAQAVPAIPTQAEIWDGVAKLIPVEQTEEGSLVKSRAGAELLAPLVSSRSTLHELSRQCYRHATAQDRTWSTIGKAWQQAVAAVAS